MGALIDFAEHLPGDPPLQSTMTARAVRWRGVEVCIFTHEHGPYPPHGDPEMLRYLGQIAALQAVLASDFGRSLVPPGRTGQLIPDTDELPPGSFRPTTPAVIDGLPMSTWAAVFRGANAIVGDPREAPFVLVYSSNDELTEWPELIARPALPFG